MNGVSIYLWMSFFGIEFDQFLRGTTYDVVQKKFFFSISALVPQRLPWLWPFKSITTARKSGRLYTFLLAVVSIVITSPYMRRFWIMISSAKTTDDKRHLESSSYFTYEQDDYKCLIISDASLSALILPQIFLIKFCTSARCISVEYVAST